jgi:hypothetical protein
MNDQFDTNIARRKPNTSGKNRPIHPWDIPAVPVDAQEIETRSVFVETDSRESMAAPLSETSAPASVSIQTPVIDRQPVGEPIKPAVAHVSVPQPRKTISPRSDLSDSINIHSNYCKLDNDISDILLQRLSASAQSVYIRLYRQSYGWNRNWAAESLPKLTEFCNLSLQTVRKAIKELEQNGCIHKQFSDYHHATVYRIFLPSEVGMTKKTIANNAGADSTVVYSDSPDSRVSFSDGVSSSGQVPDPANSHDDSCQFLEGGSTIFGGQNNDIRSLYFSGSSICNILESGGPLPKNISIHISDTHLRRAVSIIDEFYDSIGFSIVSRSLYRKSLLDYFEIIGSGFSHDDILYAVRWTFKNSRSRPESFSLIKHTMHLAMNDLIQVLKTVSGETELAREKQETLRKNVDMGVQEKARTVSPDDVRVWEEVVEMLKNTVNAHSFSAFIEPLRLEEADDTRVVISSPPDSVSWVNDHYVDRIRDSYRECTGKDMIVTVR